MALPIWFRMPGLLEATIGNWQLAIGNGFLARRVLKRYAARHGIHGIVDRAPAANIP